MTPADIDRLAAFCRLEERGYWKAATYWDGELLREQWHKDGRAWNPFDSDDDCRVVLEALTREQRKKFARELADMLYVDVCEAITYEDYIEAAVLWNNVAKLLLATPAEKCEAVLRVLENNHE